MAKGARPERRRPKNDPRTLARLEDRFRKRRAERAARGEPLATDLSPSLSPVFRLVLLVAFLLIVGGMIAQFMYEPEPPPMRELPLGPAAPFFGLQARMPKGCLEPETAWYAALEGYTVPGGYSGQAVRPIALRQCMEVARALPETPISGMGGAETWEDCVQFLMMGSSTVQICTGAMLQGYEMIEGLCENLSAYMDEEGYDSIQDMVGVALPYFSTHADLVERQRAAKREKAGQAGRDEMWKGDIAKETNELAADND